VTSQDLSIHKCIQ